MAMALRRPAARVPHDEPGFSQPDFVAEYSAETGKFPAECQLLLRFLASQVDGGAATELLEIGPGPGWMAILMAQAHPAMCITGIDISEAFVAMAAENSRRAGLADRTRFVVGDAARMSGFGDGSFDVVMSNQCLHYWNPPEHVFDEIARVLRPDGVFCIADDRRDMTWLGKLEVLWARRFLSRRIGSSWLRSLAGCLTPSEVAEALQRSALRDRGQIAVHSRRMLIHSRSLG